METLREQFARLKSEEFLKKMTFPLSISAMEDLVERESKAEIPPTAEELDQKVKAIIQEAECFFARFGLTPDRQGELFEMPIIQQCLDEIILGVINEREELERTIGKPRNGWDRLPFERCAETEKILKKLPEKTKTEKIQEIHLDEVFDRSAQEQIAAIQERLSAALEEVKNAANEQRKAMTLPLLPSWPKHEPLAAAPLTVPLPDLREKRSIDSDFKRHYSETLKVVVPQKNPPAVAEANLLPEDAAQSADHGGEIVDNLQMQTENVMGQFSGNLEARPVKTIMEDIEKMRSKADSKASFHLGSVGEEALPLPVDIDEAMPEIVRKVPITRANGVVISALKSRIQQEKEKQRTVTEHAEPNENYRQNPLANPFEGMPELPFSGRVLPGIGDNQDNENESKTLVAHRRQMGPHRFHL
jgi:chorismate mutase